MTPSSRHKGTRMAIRRSGVSSNSGAVGQANNLCPESMSAMLINRSSSPLSRIHAAKGTSNAATQLSSHKIRES